MLSEMDSELKKLFEEVFKNVNLENFSAEHKDGNVHIRTNGLYLVMPEDAYHKMIKASLKSKTTEP
jgi:hypothetical protein